MNLVSYMLDHDRHRVTCVTILNVKADNNCPAPCSRDGSALFRRYASRLRRDGCMYDRAGLATCQNELKPDPPPLTYATRHRVPFTVLFRTSIVYCIRVLTADIICSAWVYVLPETLLGFMRRFLGTGGGGVWWAYCTTLLGKDT